MLHLQRLDPTAGRTWQHVELIDEIRVTFAKVTQGVEGCRYPLNLDVRGVV